MRNGAWSRPECPRLGRGGKNSDMKFHLVSDSSCDLGIEECRRRDIDLPDLEDRQTDVEQSYTLKETELRIRQVIDRMPPQRKAIFEMSRYGNLTNAEIARQLNLSQRTVEKHIEQALKQLRTTINISIAALVMQLF